MDEGDVTGREVLDRVLAKLNGRDFATPHVMQSLIPEHAIAKDLSSEEQTQRLISAATCSENLVSMYPGWCFFW